jgi:hypothetical protein
MWLAKICQEANFDLLLLLVGKNGELDSERMVNAEESQSVAISAKQ